MIPPWILGTTGAAVALSVVILAACRSSAAPDDALPRDIMGFEDLGQGVTSGVMAGGLHVLRDRDSFEELWREHMKLNLPVPSPPEIDFEVSMVVAAFAGQKPTGGYSLRIEEVARIPASDASPSQIIVRTSETVPDEGAAVTQMLTSPFHMVRVARTDGEGVLE